MTPLTAPPSSSFNDLALNPNLLATLKQIGYLSPTPIQLQAIPPILAGHDVVGLAQTGTGKTAAFVLPILNRLLNKEPGVIRTLIVVPTRELAEQVCNSIKALANGTAIKVMTMYGGVRIESQKRKLHGPMDIIVGCPGRILDHLKQRSLSLAHVETLVLDEADHMFDLGFIDPIRQILKALPSRRQNLLFSATMPEAIKSLTRETLKNPVQVQVSPISTPDSLTHIAYPVAQHLKPLLLKDLLTQFKTESVLVFTRTKHQARKVARFLDRSGMSATSLQGNLSQNQRMENMRGFRSGKFTIMVATDIAARGIDVSTITHVINFDLPQTTEAYLHRTGRTGRASRTGDAISFVAPQEEGQFRRIERVLQLAITRQKLEGFDYNAKKQGEVLGDDRGGHAGRRFSRRDDRGERSRDSDSRSGGDRESQPFTGRRRNSGRFNRSGGGFRSRNRSGSSPHSSAN